MPSGKCSPITASAATGLHACPGLSLSTREAILAGGKRGPAVVPGKSSESLLYKAVAHQGELQMPPGKKPLAADQVQMVRQWIDAGAPLARNPVRRARPGGPSASRCDRLPNRSTNWPIANRDPADRRTLIRRATFDLTGLPPTPAEVDAFLNDTDPKAYEKLVDRLLASPRYGERWGRLWLDVARYADTGGYETDVLFPNAWRYRDYVIRSFNDDKPYDTFIKEQVAADEIWPDNLDLTAPTNCPEAKRKNLERRIGTSLYTLGAMPVEYTFFGDQYRAEWQAEAANVTGNAFLGLTVQCARCHDHKFDPISQRDYYSARRLLRRQRRPRSSHRQPDAHLRIHALSDEGGGASKSCARSTTRSRPDDKDGRETLLRQIGEAYVKAPLMYDKANILVHTEPVPDTLHSAARRFHEEGREGHARHSRPSSARARSSNEPDNGLVHSAAPQSAGRMAGLARQSAHRARDGESHLAGAFRDGPRRHAQRLRPAGRQARRISLCSTGSPSSSWIMAGA